MYIIQPAWLAKHGIVSKGVEVAIKTNLSQPGFRLSVAKSNVEWIVAPDKLAVESDDPKADCGAYIAKVLKALPETPLLAIGNNTEYKAEHSEVESLSDAIRGFPNIQSPIDGQTIGQRTFHIGVKRDEHEAANLQIAITEESVVLLTNVHAELRGREDYNDAAIRVAQRFFADRKYAKVLAQHFFGASINHDLNNA
jgi:hypothetical protein